MKNIAANSLFAIARAKHGKMLQGDHYKDLVACRTVPEVANYLRNKTRYADVLKNIKDGNIHRGHLEMLLRRFIFNEMLQISRFERSVGDPFYSYVVLSSEIRQFLSFVRFYNAGRPEEYIFAVPEFLSRHAKVDLPSLARARNFSNILESLNNSPLVKVVRQYPPENGRLDYTALEPALYNYLADFVESLISKRPAGEQKDLRSMFGVRYDLENAARIYRQKQFPGTPENSSSLLYKHTFRLRNRQLEAMLAAPTKEDAFLIFRQTWYGRFCADHPNNSPGDIFSLCYYKTLKTRFAAALSPIASILIYLELCEIELQNIIRVIEGVRYKIPKESLQSLLIGQAV